MRTNTNIYFLIIFFILKCLQINAQENIDTLKFKSFINGLPDSTKRKLIFWLDKQSGQ